MAASSSEAPRLDRSAFARHVLVAAVCVPTRHTDGAVKCLRDLLSDIPKLKPVQQREGDAAHRYLVLKDGISCDLNAMDAAVAARMSTVAARFPHTHACCPSVAPPLPADTAPSGDSGSPAGEGSSASPPAASAPPPALLVPWTLHLGYENLGPEAVLRTLLPPSLTDIPSSFESIGHVAHVNLKDEALPYRHLIGQVLLDKNPTIRTFVNKTASIETKFRTFPMEVLSGDGDTLVEVRHCRATFKFDFRTVYWNSRLQKEHEHMVQEVVPRGSLVADVFCGVGPFTIPAALTRGCTVHANDLNPASYAALRENVVKNKVGAAVTCYNLDGRAFVLHMASAGVPFTTALMNLPADALTFLDAFVGLWRHPARAQASGGLPTPAPAPGGVQTFAPRPLPVVHCYCFSKAETEEGAADDVAARALGALHLPLPTAEQVSQAHAAGGRSGARAGGAGGIDSPVVRACRALPGLLPDLTVRTVRDVAPKKLMLCVSFTLPRGVAEAGPVVTWERLDAEEAAERAAEAALLRQAAGGGGDGEGDGEGEEEHPHKRARTAL